MEHLWSAVNEYYALADISALSQRLLSAEELCALTREALAQIMRARMALDATTWEDLENPVCAKKIHNALNRARRSISRKTSDQASIFKAVFIANAPEITDLFDAMLARKQISFMSFNSITDPSLV